MPLQNKSLSTSAEKNTFRRCLLRWYDNQKRDLPWRRTSDPYHIWVSEIMLQQTRVAAVIEYYQSFLQKFPSVEELARAKEASVLAAWSGLGYYRRARMLHAAAKRAVKENSGNLPETAEGLRGLPGIGRYTAAAIASIAFRESAAVVDGNVTRVVQRLYRSNCTGEEVWDAAQGLLDPSRPGDFNQAMMELGATICVPQQPLCAACPVERFCATRGPGATARKRTRSRKRRIAYALARRSNAVFLVQRPKRSRLMASMWELPEISIAKENKILFRVRHAITVTNYEVWVTEASPRAGIAGKWIRYDRLPALPLTGLTRKILRVAGVL